MSQGRRHWQLACLLLCLVPLHAYHLSGGAIKLGGLQRKPLLRMVSSSSSAAFPMRGTPPSPHRNAFQRLFQGSGVNSWWRKLWRKSRVAFASLLFAFTLGIGTIRASQPPLSSSPPAPITTLHKKSPVSSSSSSKKGKVSKLSKKLQAKEKELQEAEDKLKLSSAQFVHDMIQLEELIEEDARLSWKNLVRSLKGTKMDSLILLVCTSVIIPLCKSLRTSPILGFLLTGTLLGPNCLSWVSDVHMMHHLGELGIVFFLFEMGLELSLDRLNKMKKDVFGLGTSQFFLTAAAVTGIAKAW